MSEEQENKPVPPRNAGERVIRIVEVMQSEGLWDTPSTHSPSIPWKGLYQKILGEEEPHAILNKLPMLLRQFERVQEFIDGGHIQGLVDKDEFVQAMLREMKRSPDHLSGQALGVFCGIDQARLSLILGLCAANMPEDCPGEEIEQILAHLQAAREELANADMDEEVKDYWIRQVDEMMRALESGKLLGVGPIREQIQRLKAAVFDAPRSRVPPSLWDAFGRTVDFANKAMDKVVCIEGKLNTGGRMIELGRNLFP